MLTKSSKNEEEWYTHKRVKSYAFQLLKVYSSGNLFRCVYENNLKLANTNNFLEGGINSPIRRLLSQHRGMKYEHQMQLVELYLFKRSKLYNLVKLGENILGLNSSLTHKDNLCCKNEQNLTKYLT